MAEAILRITGLQLAMEGHEPCRRCLCVHSPGATKWWCSPPREGVVATPALFTIIFFCNVALASHKLECLAQLEADRIGVSQRKGIEAGPRDGRVCNGGSESATVRCLLLAELTDRQLPAGLQLFVGIERGVAVLERDH